MSWVGRPAQEARANHRMKLTGRGRRIAEGLASTSLAQQLMLELTRFRGHLVLWEKGGHDAEDPSTLST